MKEVNPSGSKLISEVSLSASGSSVVWNGPLTVIDVISNSISNAANGSARQVHRPRGIDSYYTLVIGRMDDDDLVGSTVELLETWNAP